MARVFIFEPNGGGHRFWYARLLIDECNRRGIVPVLVTRPQAIRSQEYLEHISETKMLQFIRVHGPARTYRMVWSFYYATFLLFLARRGRVVVPEGDKLVVPLAVLGLLSKRSDFSLLLMRSPARHTLSGCVKRASAMLMAKRSRVFILEGQLIEEMPESIGIPRLPDPVYVCRTALDHEPSVRAGAELEGLIAGAINSRKCVDTVLEAMSMANYRLKLVGKFEESVLESISHLSPHIRSRLSIVNRFVSDEELDCAIAHSDFVFVLLRSRVGSSGIQGKALKLGKPTIVGGNPTVLRVLETTRAGVAVNVISPEAVATAFGDLSHNFGDLANLARAASKRIPAPSAFTAPLLDLKSA